eukprot:CAMPEP_0171022430 /NCGR_PEP_ID=MMETSP0736-20130129/31416_1 /TAXON_ID=186038 /ORGANISM="Fragilariopsis kerguelensis, Strain L26-C5" /LENGTH=82 /DNA_ID=CAMNT_0011461241 /DNA_START=396 /DNA_END=644 /DNA_ORIENTATION=+
MIHDVLLCYHFMRKNNDKVIVENPDHWVMEDFKDWRVNGYPTSTADYINQKVILDNPIRKKTGSNNNNSTRNSEVVLNVNVV